MDQVFLVGSVVLKNKKKLTPLLSLSDARGWLPSWEEKLNRLAMHGHWKLIRLTRDPLRLI